MTVTLSETPESIFIGAHHVQFIPPGLIRVEWNGSCSRDDFARVLEWADGHVIRKPYVLLANLARLENVTPEARQFSATDPRFALIKRIGFIGASFHQRVVATMISRAVELYYKDRKGQLQFFDSEVQALDWLHLEYARIHPSL